MRALFAYTPIYEQFFGYPSIVHNAFRALFVTIREQRVYFAVHVYIFTYSVRFGGAG